uniref:Uncharacterized protein n=1 Tax=Helianthus annuus TaxID=4232 RepID=A0A251SI47_HELAN
MIIFKTSFVRNLLPVWVLDYSPVPKLQKSEESESFEEFWGFATTQFASFASTSGIF